jgi:Zn-dependent protease
MYWQFPWKPHSTAVDSVELTIRDDGESNTARRDVDQETKLPKLASLIVIIAANTLLQVSPKFIQITTCSECVGIAQISFFIIVSSSNEYAQRLGGTSTFAGVVIGIPTVFAGLSLLPLMKLDGGKSLFKISWRTV